MHSPKSPVKASSEATRDGKNPYTTALSTRTGGNGPVTADARLAKSSKTNLNAKSAAGTKSENIKPANKAVRVNDSKATMNNTPINPFSDYAYPAPSNDGNSGNPVKRHIQVSRPDTPGSLFGPGTRRRSESPISPKTRSDKPAIQPAPQECERCGERGWSAGYCPKCGAGNAFGLS